MLDRMQNYLATLRGMAVGTDARLPINPGDRDGRKRRQAPPADMEQTETDGDQATVSIRALKTFLETLLEPEKPLSHGPSAPDVAQEWRTPAPMAARAYRHAAQNNAAGQPSGPPILHASEADQARLAGFIQDLMILAAYGVETVTIRRGSTFFDSIGAAIDAARADRDQSATASR